MATSVPVLVWGETAFGGHIATLSLDAAADNSFNVTLAGTAPNNVRIIPKFVVIDNLANNSSARIAYGGTTYLISPYTRKSFPILALLNSMSFQISLGVVGLIFADFDPGIPDDLNQYALSSGNAGISTTWDATRNTSGLIVLNAGNLQGTYSNPGPNVGAALVCDVAKNTGKFYWEPKYVTNVTPAYFGIALQTFTPLITAGNSGIGFDPGSVAIGANGNVRYLSASLGNGWINPPSDGDSVRMAVDLTNSKIWCARLGQNWNNDPTADPATGTNGFSFAGITAGAKCTAFGANTQSTIGFAANFGAVPFLNTIPAGFTPWA